MRTVVASMDNIKQLREETGAGIMDCKRALEDAAGDIDKAKGLLRERGIARAEGRSGRVAGQGLVHSYVHSDRVGALVEVNCETDFVARTDDFKALVHEIAMQVASMNPAVVSREDLDSGDQRKSLYWSSRTSVTITGPFETWCRRLSPKLVRTSA
jgi:elongation factor Ts